MQQKYSGTVYIGVVGPEDDKGACWETIVSIARRAGDSLPLWVRGTKGYEGRQKHFDNFIDSHHDFLLLLDHDMTFPVDTLERLRSHGRPYVSGLYMRRRFDPIAPIWFKPFRDVFPMEPWLEPITRDKLHPIGASGWGCILIHREVVMAVRELLKGEDDVLEDDMDLWPYDLERLMGAVGGLAELVAQSPPAKTLRAALVTHVATLQAELRPLRAQKDIVGSDIRYPFYALKAGFPLVGDPNVRCGHIISYPVSADDFDHVPADHLTTLRRDIQKQVREYRDDAKRILGVLA